MTTDTISVNWIPSLEPASWERPDWEVRSDHLHMPEKFELIDGQLFWEEEQRLHLLAMLLENVGL